MVANQVYSEDEMEKLYEYLPRELVTFVLDDFVFFINRTFTAENQFEA